MKQTAKDIQIRLERLKRELRQHQSIAMTEETEVEVKQLMERIKRIEGMLEEVNRIEKRRGE